MDILILLSNQVHSRLQTSFLSLSSETPGSAPALLQTRCWQHWRHARVTRQIWEALGNVIDILAGKTRPMLFEHWSVFCPCTIRLNKAGHWDLRAKDINSHERTFLVDFCKKYYFNFHTWNSEYGRLTEMAYPWMEGVSLKWIAHFFCSCSGKGAAASRDELHQGWCQALAKEWHVSCKTMSLIPKAAFTFQHTNCHSLLGHTIAR